MQGFLRYKTKSIMKKPLMDAKSSKLKLLLLEKSLLRKWRDRPPRTPNSERTSYVLKNPSWRRKWQPTPVCLPGESLWTEEPAGYSPRGYKASAPMSDLAHSAHRGTSLVMEWLRICLPMEGTWVQSLVGELRSHIPRGQLSSLTMPRERTVCHTKTQHS